MSKRIAEELGQIFNVQAEIGDFCPTVEIEEKILTSHKTQSIQKFTSSEINTSSNVVEEARKRADSAKNIEDLKYAAMNFDGCELKNIALNFVFSDGSDNPKIMFIGEAPGEQEDREGIPFCGKSGKLLRTIIQECGITRTEYRITNTVFWRPPGNRKPSDDELAVCLPFVEKHIALANPSAISIIGGTAFSSLFPRNELTISKVRGQVFEYTNIYMVKPIPAIPTFHPSYLLRQPTKIDLSRSDIELALKQCNINR